MILATASPALSREQKIVLAAALLFPVVLSVLFFPTASADLREQLNWGKSLPFHTPKHPPLQSLLPGLLALLDFRDAWSYIAFAMLLNAVALFYLYRIAKEFIAENAGLPALLAGCGTAFVSPWVISSALNADQIQSVFWLGTLYHVLRALERNRWTDWILTAIFAAICVLAKFFSALFLLSLALSALSVAPYRRVVLNPRAYLALVLFTAILSPYFVALGENSMAIVHAARQLQSAIYVWRLEELFVLFLSLLFGGVVTWLLAIILFRRGTILFSGWPSRASAQMIAIATAILVAGLSLGILFLGMRYSMRFSAPIVPMTLLSAIAMVRWEPVAVRDFTRGLSIAWLCIYLGGIAFGVFGGNRSLRDPADLAAKHMHEEWESRYSCGPAYVIGMKRDAFAIATYMGPRVQGADEYTFKHAHWVKSDRVRKYGAVIVGPEGVTNPKAFAAIDGKLTPAKEFSAPYRRSLGKRQRTYRYQFLPPESCS